MNEFYLLKALEVAKFTQGFTAPNPPVGAVIANSHGILSIGWHERSGADHAEVMAVKNLKHPITKDSVLYVTLEPCCHFGKTPPCTDLIIASNIKKVVYAVNDLHDKVYKKATNILLQENIDCQQHQVQAVDDFYKFYNYWYVNKKSWLTAKIALTANRVFSSKNQALKITKPPADYWTHQQRKVYDAILTTSKTIAIDNPSLSVRYGGFAVKPLLVISRDLSINFNANCFKLKRKVILIYSEHVSVEKLDKIKKFGYCVEFIDSKINDTLFWDKLASIAANYGLHSVWCEMGAKSLIFALESGVLMDYYEIIATEHQQGEFVGFTNDSISASISKTELDQDLLVSYNKPIMRRRKI